MAELVIVNEDAIRPHSHLPPPLYPDGLVRENWGSGLAGPEAES
jgi:hypothetical protein